MEAQCSDHFASTLLGKRPSPLWRVRQGPSALNPAKDFRSEIFGVLARENIA
jgi:hypothetical protein